MNRLFLIAMAAIVIFCSALAILLYVSLIPHFGQIGDVATVVLVVVLACGTSLAVAFTWYKIRSWNNRSHLLVHGDVVVFMHNDGSFNHLSAEHVRAGVPAPAMVVNALSAPTVPDETIIDCFTHGNTLQTICEITGEKYNRVQKVTSDYKKRHADA
jgi:hypothetical protein